MRCSFLEIGGSSISTCQACKCHCNSQPVQLWSSTPSQPEMQKVVLPVHQCLPAYCHKGSIIRRKHWTRIFFLPDGKTSSNCISGASISASLVLRRNRTGAMLFTRSITHSFLPSLVMQLLWTDDQHILMRHLIRSEKESDPNPNQTNVGLRQGYSLIRQVIVIVCHSMS